MATASSHSIPSRRRESSRLAILDAALAMCREGGYAKLSIEAIAARAGVGKQTIYRWWPSKGAVLLDALSSEAALAAQFPETDDLVADLEVTVSDVARFQADPALGAPLAALLAEAQHDASLRPLILEKFIRPRRAPIVGRMQRAQKAGLLSSDLDPEAVLEVVFGALFHRLLLNSGSLDAAYAAFVVGIVFRGTAAVRPSDAGQQRTRQQKIVARLAASSGHQPQGMRATSDGGGVAEGSRDG